MIKIQVDLPVAEPYGFATNARDLNGLTAKILPLTATCADRYVRLEGPLHDLVGYLLDWWDHEDIPEALENAVLLFDGEDD